MTRDDSRFFTVSELNDEIKSLLESDARFLSVCVQGELSNYKVYPSGHHYFTLKDAESSLKCVMFRSSASRLRFRPENGMLVFAVGRVQVYLRDGAYQLYCNELIPNGIGDLQLAFEQLKQKLFREGLFDASRKKPLPQFPGRIVLITSSAGAAVHDMLRILRVRWPMAEVLLYPVRVQGREAPQEIADAVRKVNAWSIGDIIITGRGGGSLEDLWAFNDERVARAIDASVIPVVSAVGHEPDVTISDFVADRRAATPSNAAELSVPDQQEVRETVNALAHRLDRALERQQAVRRQRLERYSKSKTLSDVSYFVDLRRMEVDRFCDRLNQAGRDLISKNRSLLGSRKASLEAMSPLAVLSRGYLIAENDRHQMLRSIHQVAVGEHLTVQFADGAALCRVENREVKELGKEKSVI